MKDHTRYNPSSILNQVAYSSPQEFSSKISTKQKLELLHMFNPTILNNLSFTQDQPNNLTQIT